jgi:hypothetical protein
VQTNVSLSPELLDYAHRASIERFGRINVAGYMRMLLTKDMATTTTDMPTPAPDPAMPHAVALAELTEWAQEFRTSMAFDGPADGSHWHWSGLRMPAPFHQPLAHDGITPLRDWLYERYRSQDHVSKTEYPPLPVGHSAMPTCGHPGCINPKHLRPADPQTYNPMATVRPDAVDVLTEAEFAEFTGDPEPIAAPQAP